jgi:hypothetical protein
MENLNYKRISGVLLILVILLIIPHMCNNTGELEGRYKEIKKQYNAQKELVKTIEKLRQEEKDSLNDEIKTREWENSDLISENNRLRDKIKNQPRINVPKDVIGLVKYFNHRYKTNENKVVDNKVGLTEEVAFDVSYELEEGDRTMEIVKIQDTIIDNQEKIIVNLNKDKVDLSTILISSENEIQERKKLQEMSDKNINNLEKQVKREKKLNKFNKILIATSGVLGFIIGNRL